MFNSGTYCHKTSTRPPSYVTPRLLNLVAEEVGLRDLDRDGILHTIQIYRRYISLGDHNRWRGSNKYSDLLTRSIYSTLLLLLLLKTKPIANKAFCRSVAIWFFVGNPGYYAFSIFNTVWCAQSKLMRIELSNREWPFVWLLCRVWLPTFTVIVRYSIFEVDDVWCIVHDFFDNYIRICM